VKKLTKDKYPFWNSSFSKTLPWQEGRSDLRPQWIQGILRNRGVTLCFLRPCDFYLIAFASAMSEKRYGEARFKIPIHIIS
jgi:hypothetical protein